MSETLYPFDVAIFRAVNRGLSNPWFDRFFSFITDWHNYQYFIMAWFLFLLVRGGPRGRIAVVGVIAAVLLADLVSSHLLKDLVARVRPCNALTDVLTPLGKRNTFSFPSSHGTTMGAAFVALTMFFRRWWPLWLAFAGSVALSRVYLGLHYPSDVTAGLLVGSLLGALVAWPLQRWILALTAPQPQRAPEPTAG